MTHPVRGGLLPRLMFAAVAALLFVLAPLAARADEVITSYNTAVRLAVNGNVDVIETITVRAEADQIRHGIYRDIPTQLTNDDNSRLRSTLDVIEVKRDGQAEPYTVSNIDPPDGSTVDKSRFKRIRIGSADVLLDPGNYTYTIHYTMTRMARLFADHDELFWNATGNYWAFPIEKATATLIVPDGAQIDGAIGYTGPPGSTEQAVTISNQTATSASFAATRTLQPGEGLTVAVKFQKGILTMPEGIASLGNWLSDHRELVFPAIGALIVLLYNYFAWSSVGRDPRKGTIIPLFHPPEGLSAPMVHYVKSMGFKQSGWTALTSAIFDLGVRGLVMIDKVGKSTRITSLGADGAAALPAEEKGIFDYLRAKGVTTIDKTDGPALNTRRREMVTAITKAAGSTYFKNNVGYTLLGFALSLLILGALVLLDIIDPGVLVVAAVVSAVLGVILGLVSNIGSRGWTQSVFVVIWIAVIGFNVFGSSLSFLSRMNLDTGMIGAASIILIQVFFAFIMRAPTVAGRALMDKIEGFKMYLDTAEKNRLNYVEKGEPPMTVKRFESILPFAIALGVEKPWTQRFEGDLARNAVADAQGGYSPLWYRGNDWSSSSSGFSNVVSSMATGMSAAMIAAQPSSSSGSGFSGGGGGGSGGGGGGGGGGGW